MKHTKQERIDLISKLSNAFGPSGFEDDVVEIGKEELKDVANVKVDHLKNVFVEAKRNVGNRPKVWLDAHSDEVGFIVQAVKPNGSLVFLPLGGWDASSVAASKLKLKNDGGELVSGVIAAKPPHFMSEAEKGQAKSISSMVIDVGAMSAKETEEIFQIGIASPAVPDVVCEYNEDTEVFLGKAFDCRIGVASFLETFHQIGDADLKVDVAGTISVQEEVGVRGIQLAANHMKADLAIVFEGAPADDTFAEGYMVQAGMKKGPSLRYFDSTMITNTRFMKYALDIAKKHEIPVQVTVRSGGGTNARGIHLADHGIPTIVIGIPVRYIHSHYGYVAYQDYEDGVKLAMAILQEIDGEVIKSF